MPSPYCITSQEMITNPKP